MRIAKGDYAGKADQVTYSSKRTKSTQDKFIAQDLDLTYTKEEVDAVVAEATAGGGGGVTIDDTGGSAGDVVRFDGTGYYVDAETVELPAAGTAGNLLESNGTVFVSAAPKLPAPGTAGNVPVSNGSAWIATAPDAGVVTATGQAAGEVPQFDGSNGYTTFKVTISTSAPSGGSDGDLWFKY